jgi:hypothetical protein
VMLVGVLVVVALVRHLRLLGSRVVLPILDHGRRITRRG